MKAKHLIWPAGLVVIGLGLATACREQTPAPTPTPTAAPTVVGLITPGPGTTTPTCQVTPPVGWGVYVVQRGDTLLDLAAGRGATVEQVRQVNCLASNVLVAGTSIYLPLLPTPTPCRIEVPVGWGAHQVQTGDTLFSLAANRQTLVAEIERVNCLPAETVLVVGQTLYLPLLPTPTPTFTPSPSPPPPTPRPTPTFPLVTPTPGIVSLPTMPPIQTSGQQQPGGDNQPGSGNAQTGPASNQPGGGEPPDASPAQMNRSNLLPVIVLTYATSNGAYNSCGDSGVLHRPGPYYYKYYPSGPDLPDLFMATDANWVSLQFCGWSLTQPITLTFFSPDPQVVLSGSLRIENGQAIWKSDPPKGESDAFGWTFIVDYGDSQGDMSFPIEFMLPPGLPPGRWSLAVSYLAGTELEKISFYNPPVRLWVDPNRLGFTYQGCMVLSYDEVTKEPIRVAGNSFPLDLGTPIPLGVYHHEVKDDRIVSGTLVVSYTLIASKTAEITEGTLSTTISIDPAKIITGTEYLVAAAINPAGLPVEAEREIFDCFYVLDGTEFKGQSLPGDWSDQTPDDEVPTDQLPPVWEGPGKIPLPFPLLPGPEGPSQLPPPFPPGDWPDQAPDGGFPTDPSQLPELPTVPPDESIGFVPIPSSFADPPAALPTAPAGAPQAADDSTRPAVARPPVGDAGYNLLPILGLLEVAGLGGWLWLRRRRE